MAPYTHNPPTHLQVAAGEEGFELCIANYQAAPIRVGQDYAKRVRGFVVTTRVSYNGHVDNLAVHGDRAPRRSGQ